MRLFNPHSLVLGHFIVFVRLVFHRRVLQTLHETRKKFNTIKYLTFVEQSSRFSIFADGRSMTARCEELLFRKLSQKNHFKGLKSCGLWTPVMISSLL